ncbi:cytochrome P450 [Pseudovibrio japonicus]|uniref:Cytochrome P450 n=1 Tax=Pseudovibrio japonicus TaxID=366534 RepID=A0ABQ3EN30_9HYPH|nr:cytochrome P450 [Pseudovibrio japonicus]GHB42581.1 cytochrome P450 [Pseudovibrio japonicus]
MQQRTLDPILYRPPAPIPCKPLRGLRLLRIFWSRNVLDLIPEELFNTPIQRIPAIRRPCYLVNSPDLANQVLIEMRMSFPKSYVMVDTLMPVVGESTMTTSGSTWDEQREMIAPASSHVSVRAAYAHVEAACNEFLSYLDGVAESGKSICLRDEMDQLTADIIFRSIFSHPMDNLRGRRVFELARQYQTVTSSWVRKTVLRGTSDKPKWPMPKEAQLLRDEIRRLLSELVDEYTADRFGQHDDLCQRLLDARHPQSGLPFNRGQLVDHIATFCLAGHQTTSSALTWAFFILSQRPDYTEHIRRETDEVTSGENLDYTHVSRLVFTRNIFREALRLYPPIAFISRMATEETMLGGQKIPRGALIIISPWVVHRHRAYWNHPDYFDPDRFERDDDPMPGAYMPFGVGPRVCTGASLAMVEGTAMLAGLSRHFTFKAEAPEKVFPEVAITLRPQSEIMCTLTKRDHMAR